MQAETGKSSTLEHFSHVSIRELTSVSLAGRQEIKHDLHTARAHGMGVVSITPGGTLVPAAITLRTTVSQQILIGGRVRDNWHVVIAPSDSEGLLRRLFAERNRTRMGALDMPLPKMVEASYDMVRALDHAHEALSKLSPPRVGTFLEITFAFTRSLAAPVITFRPSSVEVVRRARGWAKHRNSQELERWRAQHFPLTMPVFLGGLRLWPWWTIEDPALEAEPEIPQNDSWEPGGEFYLKIGDVVAEHFLPILESLWKATFKQDEYVATQLRTQGFNLDAIDATKLGIGSLGALTARFKQGQAHMTMMADPDLVMELGEQSIRSLTRHDGGVYTLSIQDEEER
jgi:hypothetical protein